MTPSQQVTAATVFLWGLIVLSALVVIGAVAERFINFCIQIRSRKRPGRRNEAQ